MHWWYGYGPEFGFWMFPFGAIFWLVVLGLVVALIVWLIRGDTQARKRYAESNKPSPALDILEERFARGEIDHEEYLKKRRDLLA